MHALERKLMSRQQGLATVLIILLAGLAITVTALGVAHVVRGAQEKSSATQAAAMAQSRAWAGVEILRQYLETLPDAAAVEALPASIAVTPASLGVTIGNVTVDGTSPYTVTADVTGNGADSSATVRVVYAVTPGSTGSTGGQCAEVPPALLVFNGNTAYSGGSLVIEDSDQDFENVAINGSLSVSSGSSAKVSGCATGDISLSGGGIDDGAALYSGGTISISNMSPPKNVTIWAKNVNITQFDGTYTSVKAGGFRALVQEGSTTVGTTTVGGEKKPDGTIVLLSSGKIVITLSDNTTQFVVDLEEASISPEGIVTVGDAAELLSGSGSLPASFSLIYDALSGGTIGFKKATVGTMWGNTTTLDGWDGVYTTLWSYGNITMYPSTFQQELLGGADLKIYKNNGSPSFASGAYGRLGGTYTGGSKPSALLDKVTPNPMTSLPGIPYCDTSVKPVDVDSLQGEANYIFYFNESGQPLLRVQNVKTSSGADVPPGPYNLLVDDVRTIGGKDFMQCGWYNSHCFRNTGDTNTTEGWKFDGIYKFPPGVVWFDRKVTYNGVDSGGQPKLYNTILAVGDVNLTSSGHVPLYAPNYAPVATICDGSFYPANLCDKSTSPSRFVTWTDAEGTEHVGLPIGNLAVATEGSWTPSGWEVHGNVILGSSISTSGATVTIYGTLTVGANSSATTTISQGGIKIVTTGVTEDQKYIPGGGCSPTVAPTTPMANVLWTRYL